MIPVRYLVYALMLETAALLGIGVLAYREHEAKVRAEAMVEPLEERVRTARDSASKAEGVARRAKARADSLSARYAERGRALDSLMALVEADVEDATEAADVAGLALEPILDTIRASLPEPRRPLVDSARQQIAAIERARESVTEAFRNQRAEFLRFRASADSTVEAMRFRAQAAEEEARRWKAVADAEREAKLAWKEQATEGTWERIRGAVPGLSVQGSIAGAIGIAGGWYLRGQMQD